MPRLSRAAINDFVKIFKKKGTHILDVYRGEFPEGVAKVKAGGFATDPGVHGSGIYYTTDRSVAALYAKEGAGGVVKHRIIKVENPITDKAELDHIYYKRILSEADGDIHANYLLHTDNMKKEADAVRAEYLSKGTTGAIANFTNIVVYDDEAVHVLAERGKNGWVLSERSKKIWKTRRLRYGRDGHK